jgi:hypothetical protein
MTSITTEDAATDDVATGAPLHAATPTATSTARTLWVRATVIRVTFRDSTGVTFRDSIRFTFCDSTQMHEVPEQP